MIMLEALGDVVRGVGEVVRRADVARQHPEAARERVALADGLRRADAGVARGLRRRRESSPPSSGARCSSAGGGVLSSLKSHAPAMSPRPAASISSPQSVRRRRRRSRPTPRRLRLATGDRRGAAQRRRAIRRGSHSDEQHALNSALAAAEGAASRRGRRGSRAARARVPSAPPSPCRSGAARRAAPACAGERDDEQRRVEPGEIRARLTCSESVMSSEPVRSPVEATSQGGHALDDLVAECRRGHFRGARHLPGEIVRHAARLDRVLESSHDQRRRPPSSPGTRTSSRPRGSRSPD